MDLSQLLSWGRTKETQIELLGSLRRIEFGTTIPSILICLPTEQQEHLLLAGGVLPAPMMQASHLRISHLWRHAHFCDTKHQHCKHCRSKFSKRAACKIQYACARARVTTGCSSSTIFNQSALQNMDQEYL